MTATSLPRPADDEYGQWYAGYIAEVPDGEILKFLETQLREVRSLLATVSEGRGGHRYAEGKWSIKEVIGHLCDAERIFCYRALRFARNDATDLAGFDENSYVPAGNFDARTMASLVDEVLQVRDATLSLVRTLGAEAGARRGNASGKSISVRALVWIIAGHMAHHVAVLRERYGVGA
ncbi:MAG: DinB family protein [Gemmatimonadales bacterium]